MQCPRPAQGNMELPVQSPMANVASSCNRAAACRRGCHRRPRGASRQGKPARHTPRAHAHLCLLLFLGQQRPQLLLYLQLQHNTEVHGHASGCAMLGPTQSNPPPPWCALLAVHPQLHRTSSRSTITVCSFSSSSFSFSSSTSSCVTSTLRSVQLCGTAPMLAVLKNSTACWAPRRGSHLLGQLGADLRQLPDAALVALARLAPLLLLLHATTFTQHQWPRSCAVGKEQRLPALVRPPLGAWPLPAAPAVLA